MLHVCMWERERAEKVEELAGLNTPGWRRKGAKACECRVADNEFPKASLSKG